MESQSPDSSSSKSKSSSPDPAAGGLEPLPTGSRGKKTRLPGMSPQMATFALQQRPRTKRACATKVRTGCITCKRRHVKCDETRPFCLKCTKSPRGPGVCEGYGPDRSSNRHQAVAPRRIVAKSAGTWRDPTAGASGDILLEPGYEGIFFADPEERGYFDFWRVLVGNIYLFPTDVMSRILPQLARREPAIKHAALAMAGMARALVPSVKRRPRRELHGNGPHYEFALRHYGRAIKLVRTSKVSSENMLWAIICSVLFVTFECLHGDRNAALSHVNHAYKMMEHYFSQRRSSSSSSSADGASSPTSPTSPTSSTETDSIRSLCNDAAWIFQGLTMQSWSHNVLHPKDPSEISWCCRGTRRALAVEEVPPKFADLQEARRWWRVVQHYTCHRCPIYTDMYADDLSPEMLAGSYVRSTPMPCEINELTAVLPTFLGHLQRWNAAFRGVFEELRQRWARDGSASPSGSSKDGSVSPKDGGNSSSPKDGNSNSSSNSTSSTPDSGKAGPGAAGGRDYEAYIEACNLRVQYLLLWTDVTSLSYKDIRTLKRLTPAFREMTQLSRVILEAQSNCGGCTEVFSMDNGPTLPLLTVACRCRDAGLRREATDLLGKHHRRDGLWDSRTFHGIALRNMGIETENAIVGGDDIEQWARVSRSEAHIDRHGELTGKILRWHAELGEWRTVAEKVAL